MDLLGSLADLYFRAGDNKNSVLKFEQAQMLDPYLIEGNSFLGQDGGDCTGSNQKIGRRCSMVF